MKITSNLIKAARKAAKKYPLDALQFDFNKNVKADTNYDGEIEGYWVPCVIYLYKKEMPNE